jgi:hypothetical protein
VDVPVTRSGRLGRTQQHVGDDRHADVAPLMVAEIHLPHADCRSHPHQPRARQQSSFGDRPEVVYLQLDGGEAAHSFKPVIQRSAHRRIGDTRGDASMQRTSAVQQFGTHTALDGDAIAMRPNQLKSEQMIEGVTGQQTSSLFDLLLGIAQGS